MHGSSHREKQAASAPGVALRDDSAMQVPGFQAVTVWRPVSTKPQPQQSQPHGSHAAYQQPPSPASAQAGGDDPEHKAFTPSMYREDSAAAEAPSAASPDLSAQMRSCLTAAKPNPSFSAATQQLLQVHHQLASPGQAAAAQHDASKQAAVHKPLQGRRRIRSELGSSAQPERVSAGEDTSSSPGQQEPFQFLKRTSLRRSVQGRPLPAASPVGTPSASRPHQQQQQQILITQDINAELGPEDTAISSSCSVKGGYTEAEASFPGPAVSATS